MRAVVGSDKLPLRLLTQGTDERVFAEHADWIFQRYEHRRMHIHELSDGVHRHSERTIMLLG